MVVEDFSKFKNIFWNSGFNFLFFRICILKYIFRLKYVDFFLYFGMEVLEYKNIFKISVLKKYSWLYCTF